MVILGWSVHLATLFLDWRGSPKWLTSSQCPYFRQLLTTALHEIVESGNDRRKDFKISFLEGMWPERVSNPCHHNE